MRLRTDASKTVIVCALKEECAAVEAGLSSDFRHRFELIRAGVGPVSAARAAKELASRKHPPELIVSTGFCGGLADDLKVGDVVVGSEIMGTHEPHPAVSEIDSFTTRRNAGGGLEQFVCEVLHCRGIKPYLARMICAENAVTTAAQKRELGKKFCAQAVDMESHAFVSNVDSTRTRVIFMRAVSDAVSDELPAEVGEFLNEQGNVRLGKITRFVLKNPSNIKRLMELKKRSDIAAKALTDAWRAIRDIHFE